MAAKEIDYRDTIAIVREARKEEAQVKEVAKAYVKHFYNEKGEQLARVEDSEAFQEVYDFHGDQKRRHKLGRKMEQVHNTYDARTQLFQKVYYAKGLTLEDERSLRTAYEQAKQSYEMSLLANNVAVFGAFLGSTFWVSRRVQPVTVGLWTIGWFYGYKQLTIPFHTSRFQNSLNYAAQPLAAKYGVSE